MRILMDGKREEGRVEREQPAFLETALSCLPGFLCGADLAHSWPSQKGHRVVEGQG